MKPFVDRVKCDLTVQGQYVFRIRRSRAREFENEQIDLICMKHGLVTFIRARGNGHGELNRMTTMRLQMLGKQCGARVLYAHVNGENEIVFERVYER